MHFMSPHQKNVDALMAELAAALKGSDSCKSSLESLKQQLQYSQQGGSDFSISKLVNTCVAWGSAAVEHAKEALQPVTKAAEPYVSAAHARLAEGQAAVAPLLVKAQVGNACS